MNNLLSKKCVPCEAGTPPLTQEKVQEYLTQLDKAWRLENNKITREFKFENFKESIEFVNKVAKLAEHEGHHPNIMIEYSHVTLTLWTHTINGLSENDFILAAKMDNLNIDS